MRPSPSSDKPSKAWRSPFVEREFTNSKYIARTAVHVKSAILAFSPQLKINGPQKLIHTTLKGSKSWILLLGGRDGHSTNWQLNRRHLAYCIMTNLLFSGNSPQEIVIKFEYPHGIDFSRDSPISDSTTEWLAGNKIRLIKSGWSILSKIIVSIHSHSVRPKMAEEILFSFFYINSSIQIYEL